jgi:hypothetical protein
VPEWGSREPSSPPDRGRVRQALRSRSIERLPVWCRAGQPPRPDAAAPAAPGAQSAPGRWRRRPCQLAVGAATRSGSAYGRAHRCRSGRPLPAAPEPPASPASCGAASVKRRSASPAVHGRVTAVAGGPRVRDRAHEAVEPAGMVKEEEGFDLARWGRMAVCPHSRQDQGTGHHGEGKGARHSERLPHRPSLRNAWTPPGLAQRHYPRSRSTRFECRPPLSSRRTAIASAAGSPISTQLLRARVIAV